MHRQSRILAASARLSLLAAAGLAGCSSSVVVQSDFPAPLVEPLPLRMGVIFDDELHNYIYYEELPQHTAWTIDMGDANVGMLRPLFTGMFNEIELIDSVDAAPGANVDGVLFPQLEKFEFDVPIGRRDEFAEVWLQYVLTLYEPDGDVVHRWTVAGYGKSELQRDQEEAVKRAAVVALRDVGATIATRFSEQQPIRSWLSVRNGNARSVAGAGTSSVGAGTGTSGSAGSGTSAGAAAGASGNAGAGTGTSASAGSGTSTGAGSGTNTGSAAGTERTAANANESTTAAE